MVSVGFGGLGLFERRRNQAAFVGAYDDIPSVTAAYGMRRLRTAYAGSILRIRRSSDNTESDIGYTGTGDLDTAAVASFVGGGSGYIVTWYDQSGNGYNATQTTAASQPLYVASGQNGRPVGRWDGTNDFLSASVAPGNAISFVFAFKSTTTAIGSAILSGSGFQIQRGGNPGPYSFNNLANVYLFSSANWRIMSNIAASKTSGAVYENGLNVLSGNPSATSWDLSYIGKRGDGIAVSADLSELIICNAALSTGDRQAAEAAANAYWAVY